MMELLILAMGALALGFAISGSESDGSDTDEPSDFDEEILYDGTDFEGSDASERLTVADSVETVADATINLGAGDDQLELISEEGNQPSAFGVRISGGEGDDTIVGERFISNRLDLGTGDDSFEGSLINSALQLGQGDDVAYIDFLLSSEIMTTGPDFNLPQGDDTLIIGQMAANSVVLTDDGNDLVRIENVQEQDSANRGSIQTGAGDDTIDVAATTRFSAQPLTENLTADTIGQEGADTYILRSFLADVTPNDVEDYSTIYTRSALDVQTFEPGVDTLVIDLSQTDVTSLDDGTAVTLNENNTTVRIAEEERLIRTGPDSTSARTDTYVTVYADGAGPDGSDLPISVVRLSGLLESQALLSDITLRF